MDLKQLHEKRQRLNERLKNLNDEVKEAKEEIAEIDDAIYGVLENAGIDYAVVGDIRYERVNKKVYNITDFDRLWEWAKEHDAPFVFQRRISQANVASLISSSEVPYGIEEVSLPKLRVVKR